MRTVRVLLIAVTLTCLFWGSNANGSEKQLSVIQTWLKDKLGDVGRRFGGGGGDGYGMDGYEDKDDDDDGIFGGGSLAGGLLMLAVVLGGVAVLSAVFAPILMMFYASPGTGTPTSVLPVFPTIIPTIRRRRRRNVEEMAGIGASGPSIRFTADKLTSLENSFNALKVDEKCKEHFICTIYKKNLLKKLLNHEMVFSEVHRLDLSGVEKSNKVHNLKKAALDGIQHRPCQIKPIPCTSPISTIVKLLKD